MATATSITSGYVTHKVTEINNLANLPSADKVKKITNQLIAHLSREHLPEPISKRAKIQDELLTLQEQETLRSYFSSEAVRNLINETPVEGFNIIGKGSHFIVWSHSKFPDVALRIMKSDQITPYKSASIQTRERVQQLEECDIYVPKCLELKLDDTYSVYVEERLSLILKARSEQDELWIRLISHYEETNDPVFKTNFEKLSRDIQTLVEDQGIWDILCHNLEVRKDGSGFYLFDFETINPPYTSFFGLENLSKILPIPPFIDPISEAYKRYLPGHIAEENKRSMRYGCEPTTEEFTLKQFSASVIESRLSLRAKQAQIKHEDQKKDPSNKSERILCDFVKEKINEWRSRGDEMNSSLDKMLLLQPGIFCSYDYSHERFVKVLESMQKNGTVVSWYDDSVHKREQGLNLSNLAYTIYFD